MKRRSGRSGGNIRGANADSSAIVNTKRLSPLPLISSSPATHHPPLTKTYESERYNFNLTLLQTPKPAASPALAQASKPPTPVNNNTIRSISDVRDLLSSRLESLKREMESTHSGILKEMDASSARLSKRLKVVALPFPNLIFSFTILQGVNTLLRSHCRIVKIKEKFE